MGQRKALGRGLEALITPRAEEKYIPDPAATVVRGVDVDLIELNPYQPRARIDPRKFEELVASVKEKGIIQPIILNRLDGERYVLIAGERRLKAFKAAGKTTIPAITMDVSEEEMLELAVIENIQREDLNPIEEARAYRMLQEKFDLTQEEISRKMGKDRSTIANALRLLNLPEEIQEMVQDQQLSSGHARAILSLETPLVQVSFAREVVKKGLSVRDVESRVRKYEKGDRKGKKEGDGGADPHISSLEDLLKRTLGTQVKIRHRGSRGSIEITFSSPDEFERLMSLLRGMT